MFGDESLCDFLCVPYNSQRAKRIEWHCYARTLSFLSACLYDDVSQCLCLQKKNRSRIDAEPSFILAINNIPPWIHEQMEGKASSISLRDAFPITFYTCMNAKFSLKLEYIVSCYYILIVS